MRYHHLIGPVKASNMANFNRDGYHNDQRFYDHYRQIMKRKQETSLIEDKECFDDILNKEISKLKERSDGPAVLDGTDKDMIDRIKMYSDNLSCRVILIVNSNHNAASAVGTVGPLKTEQSDVAEISEIVSMMSYMRSPYFKKN